MRGINYGHHFNAANFDPQTVQNDLAMLQQAGFTAVRIAYPPFDSVDGVARCQAMVRIALERGLSVIWGVGAGGAILNPSRWVAFKDYVKNSFLPWADSLQHPSFTASLGNEEDFHNDASLPAATVRSDIAFDLATYAKQVLTISTCDYVTDAGQRGAWYAQGLGDLDRIGFNLYYEWLPAGTFRIALEQMVALFDDSFYIAEWNTSGGFQAAQSLGEPAETNWAENLLSRQSLLLLQPTENYFFTFKDGAFGLPADVWALQKSDDSMRYAWHMLAKTRIKTTRSCSPRDLTVRSYSPRRHGFI